MADVVEELRGFLSEWFYGNREVESHWDIDVLEGGNVIDIDEQIFFDSCKESYLPDATDEEVQDVYIKELKEAYGDVVYDLSVEDIIYLARKLVCERAFKNEIDEIMNRYGYRYVGNVMGYERYARG